MRRILYDAAAYFREGNASAAASVLEDVLWSPKASKISISYWLRLPVYLQHAGLDEAAWKVLEIYRHRRKDWRSQKEIARTQRAMAGNDKKFDHFYASMLWTICCEDRERALQIKTARSSLGLGLKELKQLTKVLAENNGISSKSADSGCESFYELNTIILKHISSMNPKRLHTRLQNSARKQGRPFPKRLTDALVQYRLTEKDYSYDSVLALVRSQNLENY